MPYDFSKYAAVFLDLDGTIYHEDHALPGALELIRHLQSIGQRFACLSNSTLSSRVIDERLSKMGVTIALGDVYTAAAATCDYVQRKYGGSRRAKLFNLATDAPYELLGDSVDWVTNMDQPCDAIIVGAPSNVNATPPRQFIALSLARSGAAIIGMCADRVYPSPRGIEFGAGSLSVMIGYAAGKTPIYCGKPEKKFFTALCERLGVRAEECVIVGDNLESDIGGGKAVGMKTILTLSGITRKSELESLPMAARPDEVIEDLRALV